MREGGKRETGEGAGRVPARVDATGSFRLIHASFRGAAAADARDARADRRASESPRAAPADAR